MVVKGYAPQSWPDVYAWLFKNGLVCAIIKFLVSLIAFSSEFCEEHLQLLFTILEKSPHAAIRANTIIALGDLNFRFPNLLEPWTPNLYGRLDASLSFGALETEQQSPRCIV